MAIPTKDVNEVLSPSDIKIDSKNKTPEVGSKELDQSTIEKNKSIILMLKERGMDETQIITELNFRNPGTSPVEVSKLVKTTLSSIQNSGDTVDAKKNDIKDDKNIVPTNNKPVNSGVDNKENTNTHASKVLESRGQDVIADEKTKSNRVVNQTEQPGRSR